MLHTGVSSEGTTLKRRGLPGVWARLVVSLRPAAQVKSGALSPGLSCGPISVRGEPFKVMPLGRLIMVVLLMVLVRTITGARSRYGGEGVASKAPGALPSLNSR